MAATKIPTLRLQNAQFNTVATSGRGNHSDDCKGCTEVEFCYVILRSACIQSKIIKEVNHYTRNNIN